MKNVFIFSLTFLMSLIAASCGVSQHQPVPNSITTSTVDQKFSEGRSDVITYESHIKSIFKERCIKCHYPGGSQPNWLDYNVVSQKIQKIYQRIVIDKTMPLAPMTMELQERDLIAKWINAGAPKGVSNSNPKSRTSSMISPDVANNSPPPITASTNLVVPQKCTKDLSVALLVAVKSGNTTDVDKLLTQGACANAKDEKNRSAILIAILDTDASVSEDNYAHIIESLIIAGADPNASYNGGTALIWSEFNDVSKITLVLVKGGADLNVIVEKGIDDTLSSILGFTPLMLAVQSGDYATVSILLSNGADLLLGPKSGMTALKLADQVTSDMKRDIIIKLLNLYLPGGELSTPTFSHEIQNIIKERCALCHNPEGSPKMNWFDYGITYSKRALIYVRVVLKKDMPMNDNVTHMTDDERELIAKWVKADAPK